MACALWFVTKSAGTHVCAGDKAVHTSVQLVPTAPRYHADCAGGSASKRSTICSLSDRPDRSTRRGTAKGSGEGDGCHANAMRCRSMCLANSALNAAAGECCRLSAHKGTLGVQKRDDDVRASVVIPATSSTFNALLVYRV